MFIPQEPPPEESLDYSDSYKRAKRKRNGVILFDTRSTRRDRLEAVDTRASSKSACANFYTCRVPICPYVHSKEVELFFRKQLLKSCRWGLDCKTPNCRFKHPEGYLKVSERPCKFGSRCRNPRCGFRHSSDSNESMKKEKSRSSRKRQGWRKNQMHDSRDRSRSVSSHRKESRYDRRRIEEKRVVDRSHGESFKQRRRSRFDKKAKRIDTSATQDSPLSAPLVLSSDTVIDPEIDALISKNRDDLEELLDLGSISRSNSPEVG